MYFLDKNKIDNKGDNKLGIPANIFNAMYSGISKALSGSMSELPNEVIGILSGIFGLNSGQKPTLVDLRLKADISMNGTISSRGSLPSMVIIYPAIIKSMKLKEERQETWHKVVYVDEF